MTRRGVWAGIVVNEKDFEAARPEFSTNNSSPAAFKLRLSRMLYKPAVVKSHLPRAGNRLLTAANILVSFRTA